MTTVIRIGLILGLVLSVLPLGAAERPLLKTLSHLRIDGPREWAEFPEQPDAAELNLTFQAEPNAGEWTLRLRQQDVKQVWKVLLNGKEIGRLHRDENDMIVCWPVPPGTLVAGENRLRIEQVGNRPDDVRVGEIVLDERPMREALSEASVELTIRDVETGEPLPGRITVLAANGALMTVGAESNDHMAVRPGVIYCGPRGAKFGLPAGEYTIYAGRGFEYGIDSLPLVVKPGDTVRKTLSIRREVPTPGYVACDTHVHTFTHSRHGDATIQEQMLTLAGEGIELPVAADHNLHIDFDPTARQMGVRQYFTPVIGNEVTTKIGHFNIFPVEPGAPPPDHRHEGWDAIFDGIFGTPGVKVAILNHARDLHSDYRPFGPKHHNAVTGENLDGWKLRANAMELINSAATQTDVMRLYHDWFGMLNRGRLLTPVGASDSHDVARHFVGQARTYIRCRDDDPGNLDVNEAVANFLKGRVMVSYGLLSEIEVEGEHGPGELVPLKDRDEVSVAVRVLGPGWTTAETVELYVNGRKIREASISPAEGRRPGVKWSGTWTLPRPKHDVHLVAVARGSGVRELYWPLAKPYQPTSPVWESQVVGSTGAVWLDADGDGRRTSAYDYARRLVEQSDGQLQPVLAALKDYDEAVAAQAAGLLHARGVALTDPAVRTAAKAAGPQVEQGFQTWLEAWRESEIARREGM